MLAEHKLQPIQRSHIDHDASSTVAGKKPPSNLRHAVQPGEDGIPDTNGRRERTLPKLELEIPTAPLDRYSVMFRNLPAATRSSSLLARRSKTLGSLKSFDDNRPTTKDRDDQLPRSATEESLTPLFPPRWPTTPTSTRSPAGSKYSLFPTTTQTPVKGPGHTAAAAFENDKLGASQLKRSATSPASLSPMRDEHAVAKPQPLSLRRTTSDERVVEGTIGDGRPLRRIISHEQLASSPDEHTASTDRGTPWSTAHSLKSSVSSATTVDEIFFDIKSFRDSRGVEDGQFVMTRPASAAVELARTRSKRGVTTDRSQRPQGTQPDEPEEPIPPIPASVMTSSLAVTSAATTKHTSVNTEYFDEAIAAVERLTSPTITDVVQDVPIMVCDVPAVVAATQSPGSASINVFSSPTTISDEGHNFSPQQPKRTHEVSHLIPSPVVEVKEDLSPNSASGSVATIVPISTPPSLPAPAPPAPAEATKLPKSTASRVTAVKRVDRPIDDSPTIPQEPPRTTPSVLAQSSSPLTPEGKGESENEKPPPVPKKDAKYIPLSRYAAKNTVSRIEQAGIIPTRPARANTDDGLGISTSTNSNTTRQHRHPPRTVPLVTKERSSTLPSSLRPPSRPQTESSSTSPSAALRGLEKIVPPPASSSSASLSLSSRSQFATTTTGNAEVAVARTVSLSRKQSARVLVPPPRLGQQAGRPCRLEAPRQQTPSPPQQQQQQQQQGVGHRHRRTGSRSLSRDKIKTFMFGPSGGEQSQSDSDREKEKEKERARQQLEKQVAMREKEKEKAREKEREREPPQVLAIRKKVSDDNVHGLEQLEPPRQWEILDKSRWEILEKKAYSPVVVQQADRGHRPGLSVGLVVESV
ncbi:hypothetical protein ABEF95_011310 [Exophiala dermatitidis]